jgi:hypothetical protein
MGEINFDQPSKGTVTSTSKALTIVNTDIGGALSCIADNAATKHCIMGESKGNGVGLYGTSAGGLGLYALSQSNHGVKGESKGKGVGVYGASVDGAGVYGVSQSNDGVVGESKGKAVGAYGISVDGTGVYGVSQTFNGVKGESKGKGVGAYGISVDGTGVYGVSQTFNGVKGESKGKGVGAYGASVDGAGVYGVSQSNDGVVGESKGKGVGVYGTSATGTGISGVALVKDSAGVRAENKADGLGLHAISATGAAIHAEANSTPFPGVYVVNLAGHGIWSESKGSSTGIVGKSATGNGVHAESIGNGTGIYAIGGKLAGYFKGDVEVTGDIRLVNADCAEEFDVSEEIEPGTVMVLNKDGNLEPSCVAYDRKVAGIISGAGGFKPGIVLDKHEEESAKTRMAVALMGKVFCKVDATISPVEIGDLLTTSQTIGHAMKAIDPLKGFGAVIGKALQPLKSGKGIIPVLVALQ